MYLIGVVVINDLWCGHFYNIPDVAIGRDEFAKQGPLVTVKLLEMLVK